MNGFLRLARFSDISKGVRRDIYAELCDRPDGSGTAAEQEYVEMVTNTHTVTKGGVVFSLEGPIN